MATGTQLMLEAAIKLILSHLKIDPEMVKNEVARIRQIMADHEATQAAIVADLAAIKAALKIKTPDHENVRPDKKTGSAAGDAGKLPAPNGRDFRN
jgi:hypothetical protein